MASLGKWTKCLGLAVISALGNAPCAVASGLGEEVFRVGMVVAGAPVVEGLAEIQALFSGALGSPVEVVAARDFEALIRGQIDGRIDYAIYSATAYAAASLRCGCVEPVVSPIDASGSLGLHSILVRRPDALSDRIALGPRDSLAGSLAPQALWPRDGDIEYLRAESLTQAEEMFVDGSVDGFFGWALALTDEGDGVPTGTAARLEAAGLVQGEYFIAWRSTILRYGPHAVRSDIPADRRERLKRMLVADGGVAISTHLAPHHGGGFVAASHQDYIAVIDAVAGLAQNEPTGR